MPIYGSFLVGREWRPTSYPNPETIMTGDIGSLTNLANPQDSPLTRSDGHLGVLTPGKNEARKMDLYNGPVDEMVG